MSESQDTPSSSQVRGPSAESFLEVVERLGISDLPWMISLQHVDISLSPVQTESLLRQITSWEKEIQAWVNNPFKDNAKGANIIGVIETYSLLTALQLDSSLARNTCDALPQADGCIKIGGNSIDTIAKLYNWPAVIETALPALWQMVVDVKGQKVFTAPEQGHDDVGYLYSVFEKSKKTSKYSGMLSNLALAAAGLRSAMDGTEIPEKWGKEKAPNELKQFRDKNKYSGPQALLIPLHQALAVSPIMLLQRRDLMGKHVARHWHLLMWKHLGSPRPQLLVTVENAIWATVHQIALKPTKLHDVMEGLFNTLRTLANYDTGNGSVDFQVDQECRAFFRTLEPLFHTPTAPDRPTSPPPSRRASPAPPLPPQPTNRPTSPPPSRRASPAPPLPPQPTDRPVPPSRSTSVGDQDIVMHDDDKGVGSSKRKRSEDGDSSNESEDSINGTRFYKPKLCRKGLHCNSDIDNESESGVDDAIPYKLKRLGRKVLDPLDDEDEHHSSPHPRSQDTGGPETPSGSGGPPPQSPNVGGTKTVNEDEESDGSLRIDKSSEKADQTMRRSVDAEEGSRDHHTMADQNPESDLSDIPEDARSSDSDEDADSQTPSAPPKSKRPRSDSTSHSPKRIRFSTKDSESKSGHKSKAKASSTPSRKSSRAHSSTAAPFTPRTVQIADPNSTITILTPGARLNTTAPAAKPTTTPTAPRIATPATSSSKQTMRKPDLVGTSQDKRFSGPTQKLYDIRGEPVEINPRFHFKEHLNSILALTTGIQRAYQDKPPWYTSGQPGKIITTVSYDVYQQWAASGRLGEELNTRVILVTGVPLPRHQTFADAVKDLSTRLTAPLTCHDLSIKMGPLGDERHRETSLSQLINISQLPNVKSVNFLDIPGPLPAEIPLVHDDTLDRACFPLTWDTHQPRDSVDMAALQWTIAATPWTWHHLHIDTNGFGTLAMSTYGRKLWAVFRRKDDPCGTRPVCWQHLPKLYDDTVLNSDEYDVDYAILEPGTALVMPGGCPHMVLTLDESAIFMGRHFYQGRSIRRHLISFLHSVCIPSSTNTEHYECAISIIDRLVECFKWATFRPVDIPYRFSSQFPDIKTTEGAKDILVVCVVARLLQPLFSDYASDPNYISGISNSAHEVIQEIQGSHSHKFESPSGEEMDFYTDIYQPYLRHVCIAVVHMMHWHQHISLAQATKMMSNISEARGFEEKLAHPLGEIELDNPDLDLEVEYVAPFTLVRLG